MTGAVAIILCTPNTAVFIASSKQCVRQLVLCKHGNVTLRDAYFVLFAVPTLIESEVSEVYQAVFLLTMNIASSLDGVSEMMRRMEMMDESRETDREVLHGGSNQIATWISTHDHEIVVS